MKAKNELNLGLALLPIVAMLMLLVIGYGQYKLPIESLLLVSAADRVFNMLIAVYHIRFWMWNTVAKVDVRCPFCEQTSPVKKHGYGKSGHQRYRCQSCKRTFQLDYAYPACQPGMTDHIIDLAMDNAGIRDTARALHISINAVGRTLKKTFAAECNNGATG